MNKEKAKSLNLDSAVQDAKAMQDFELESLLVSSTAESRLKTTASLLQESTNPPAIVKKIGTSQQEKYLAQFEDGIIHIRAESPRSAYCAAYTLSTAIKAGHWPDFLGEYTPRYELRPIWIGSPLSFSITEKACIALPEFALEPNQVKRHCLRLLELGYNAIIFGSQSAKMTTSRQDQTIRLDSLIQQFHEFGIKVILKPHLTPSSDYRSFLDAGLRELVKRAPNLDYLFWEGTFLNPNFPNNSQKTWVENVLEEVHRFELALANKIPLIYQIPASPHEVTREQCKWLNELCLEIGRQTIIAFPATIPYQHEHLMSHSFWETMRTQFHPLSAPLLPLLNVGAMSLGEGLWPVMINKIIRSYILPESRQPFIGIIALVNYLPQRGSWLDSNLWITSQMLWHGKLTEQQLFSTWCSAYHPSWKGPENYHILEQIGDIAQTLIPTYSEEKRLSQEEARALVEELMARLKRVQTQLVKLQKDKHQIKENIPFKEVVSFFLRDARRIVFKFMQLYNFSLNPHFVNDDLQDSFWTEAFQIGNAATGTSLMISLLQEPKPGQQESFMRKIFNSHRL